MYHPFAFNKQDIRSIPISLITSSSIDFLVVGGGGAGGFRTGGGGGAGGYITSVGNSGGGQPAVSVFTASMNTAYYIYIGAGGNAFNNQTPSTPTSGNGDYSRLYTYFADGGGRGGIGYDLSPDVPIYRNGQPGGSGGGGGSWQYTPNYATGSGGTGSAYYGGPYGYNGGSGSIAGNASNRRGGGGGGAGAVGENALTGSFSITDAGANGGDGLNTGPGITLIYRGGGGGGGQSTTGGTPVSASGGLGGGGNGGTTTFLAGNGVDFTGGGGGGGASGVGGNGGSGVVIIRYNNEITASITNGVTALEEVDGNEKILTVTAAGISDTITFAPI